MPNDSQNEIDRLIATGKQTKARLLKRVSPPKPPSRPCRESSYQRNLIKWKRESTAVAMILSRLTKSWIHANRRYKENPAFTKQIKITSLAIILCGGFKLVPVLIKNASGEYVSTGEMSKVPTNDRCREEVILLIDWFFIRVNRGSIDSGGSKWIPRREPKLSSTAIDILLILSEQYRPLFNQIKYALLGPNKNNIIDLIDFDVFVDEAKIKLLIDIMME